MNGLWCHLALAANTAKTSKHYGTAASGKQIIDSWSKKINVSASEKRGYSRNGKGSCFFTQFLNHHSRAGRTPESSHCHLDHRIMLMGM